MSETCDRFETLISAWIDNELERSEIVEMLDHLTRCGSCRSFYRDARSLEGVVIAGSTTPATAPAELWQRIENEARPKARRRVGGWMLRVAALAFVALALGILVAPRSDRVGGRALVSGDSDEIRVELGSRQGEMTEDRFLEIATEVLEADRRYQRAMFQVMDSVMDERTITEGGGDSVVRSGEHGRTGESTRGRA